MKKCNQNLFWAKKFDQNLFRAKKFDQIFGPEILEHKF